MAKVQLPTHDRMVANILNVYKKASDTQLVEGANWYSDAHSIAGALCPGDVERGAAIIAVLSPLLVWEKNIAAAIVAAKPRGRRPAGVLGKNWEKARAARRKGANLDTIVKGQKVRDFWACIATNGRDGHAVCVDRHAAAVALGVFMDGDTVGDLLKSKVSYRKIADAYREAAARVGILPNTMQAVTWVVWRDTPWRDRPAA